MDLSDRLIEALTRFAPPGPAYRVSVRDPDGKATAFESSDPAASLAAFEGGGPGARIRVESKGPDGAFVTAIPYVGVLDEELPGAIPVTLAPDPEGNPVRLMIYDQDARAYVFDVASFETCHWIDPRLLPYEHLLRYRALVWSPASAAWTPRGQPRRVPGSGRLGRIAGAEPDPAVAADLERRLLAQLPPEECDAGALIEFYDEEGFLADAPAAADQIDDLRETLEELSATDVFVGLRWRVVHAPAEGARAATPLQNLYPFDDVLRGAARYLQGAEAGLSAAAPLLGLGADEDGPALAAAVSRLVSDLLPDLLGPGRRRLDTRRIHALREAWSAEPGRSRIVGEGLNYLRLYACLAEEARAQALRPGALESLVEPVLARIRELPDSDRSGASWRMFDGKLESLRDRARAARLFDEARAAEPAFRVAFDAGAAAYLGPDRIAAAAGDGREGLLSGLKPLNGPRPQGARPVVTLWCDPRLMAIYLPGWLGAADYCKARGLEFHVVLLADEAAAADALDRVERLRLALADLRGAAPGGFADNVSWSVWAPPAEARDRSAFHACAPYLGLATLSEAFGRDLLVHDIAAPLTREPDELLARLPREAICVQPSPGLLGVEPWRRYSPSFFYLPATDAARAALAPLQDYLAAGLALPAAPALVENALAWFVERAGSASVRLADMEGGAERPRINALFEALQPAL